MIFRNDLLLIDGAVHRLLQVLPQANTAWVISVDDGFALPRKVPWSSISGLEAIKQDAAALPARRVTSAAARMRARAMSVLRPILQRETELFDDARRCGLLREHAQSSGVSLPTLYKWLRMYWRGGQCDDALLPDYSRCGRVAGSITAGRGAKARHGKGTYQLTAEDLMRIADALEKHYFTDARVNLTQTYQRLLERHYSTLDGNGKLYVRESGDRPSLRQLRHYLSTRYPLEERLRRRVGDKDFELQHRQVLGTVMQDCHGVGHIFECDATIADVYLVATDDVQTIVGKPTIYLVVDRSSRLIVGVYVGLENPSWLCAKQALLFISQDKHEICRRFGIDYSADDWPAHMVFPQTVLADLGEWNSRGGEQFGKNLYTTVSFVPAKRADWKPIVESSFKQVRVTLQDGTPGMDPPENAKRRQGKHYEKDASLNLHQFTKQILELVIKHNRTPVRDYPLTTADLREGFVPTPAAIWNRGIASRSGVLTRYSFEHVRLQLLPTDTASVTEHGVEFKGCLYTGDEAIALGWFVQARVARFKVEVSYDPRLVDNIYVHHRSGNATPMLFNLSPRSDVHRGRSYAEVEVYRRLKANFLPAVDQARIQAAADWHSAVKPVNDVARADLARQSVKASRSARRAETKAARQAELGRERLATASLKNASAGEPPQPRPAAEVVDFKVARTQRQPASEPGGAPAATTEMPARALTIAERAQLARQRLKEQP